MAKIPEIWIPAAHSLRISVYFIKMIDRNQISHFQMNDAEIK